MQGPRCQAENPEGRRLCSACGASAILTHLAERILPSRSTLEGEQRLESSAASYGKTTLDLEVIELLKVYLQIEVREDPRKIRKQHIGKHIMLDTGPGADGTGLLGVESHVNKRAIMFKGGAA